MYFEELTARLKPRPFKERLDLRVFPQAVEAVLFYGTGKRLR